MSIFRKNMITNDWVIFEPNREKKPTEFKSEETDNIKAFKERRPYKETCPFCRGNETPNDKEIFALPESRNWQVRVIENKFASLNRNVMPDFEQKERLHQQMQGFGIHDVIIDNPRHNLTIAVMPVKEVEALLSACLKRYLEIKANPLVKHVVLFKNQGSQAGGSLEHPHTQIYGLPVMPFETVVRLREVEKYYETNKSCLLCDMVEDERKLKERLIFENDHFISFIPYAAISPYHIWIAPKHHAPSFALIEAEEVASLAAILKNVLARVFWGLKNPDFNFVVQSLTHFEDESPGFHWYLSIIPHVKKKGGLSYAGGIQLNPMMPEAAAEELRRAEILEEDW